MIVENGTACWYQKMDYRMKTYQAAFHIMPDYTTWYGYAEMKKNLVDMREMARQMRLNAKKMQHQAAPK